MTSSPENHERDHDDSNQVDSNEVDGNHVDGNQVDINQVDINHDDSNKVDSNKVDTNQVVPDEKDWTWVLQAPCEECGFDARVVPGRQVASGLRANAARWPAVLDRADARVRPKPRVWSPLEYAAHVRDVCRVFESRVNLMRSQDDPAFENWDQDATAVAENYFAQDPSTVKAELVAAAQAAATAFDAVDDGQWQRTGRRSNGSSFTIETLGQYFLHDLHHHLHDVRGLA